tara:strand:- start:196 stop:297 length:102 start_codon:yes stop_codon:yes gene_type:complete
MERFKISEGILQELEDTIFPLTDIGQDLKHEED